jgi:glycosyltransferase involved in cell wall biosynthesis
LRPNPVVSVVIPIFNGERHLEACLRSVLTQTYTDLEIVIADQNSSDRSLDIVRSFVDSRVRILPNPTDSLDLHGNWNRAVQAAMGDFVKLVGQDDVLLPQCISIQLELLRESPEAALTCGRRRIIDDRGRTFISARGLGKFAKDRNHQFVTGPEVAREVVRSGENLLGEPANVLMRRALLPRSLFDPNWLYVIDLEFYLRCLQNGGAVIDRRVVCCFRVSPQQLSAQLSRSQAREVQELLRVIAQRYPNCVTEHDLRKGAARAWLLSLIRRSLYRVMKLRTALSASDATDVSDQLGTRGDLTR